MALCDVVKIFDEVADAVHHDDGRLQLFDCIPQHLFSLYRGEGACFEDVKVVFLAIVPQWDASLSKQPFKRKTHVIRRLFCVDPQDFAGGGAASHGAEIAPAHHGCNHRSQERGFTVLFLT